MDYVEEGNICQTQPSEEVTKEVQDRAQKEINVVESLCDGGTYKVNNKRLENMRVCYRKGDNIIVFDPPRENTHVLLMEHIVNERRIAENNIFRLEKGFDKSCLVYYVERYIYHSENFYDPDNKVVLTCQIRNRQIRRDILFMYFFCGAYCTRELTQEEQEIVKKYRELVNETYDIFRS